MINRKRPRALTLTLANDKQPFLLLNGKRYTLRNFSEGGLGLWVQPPTLFGLTPGAKVSGDIVLGEEIHPVKMEVKHCSPGLVGLQFTQISKELAAMFQKLLEPSRQGAALEIQPGSGTEDVSIGFPRLWYRSQSGGELVVWYNELQKMIIALQLTWQGKWVFRHQYELPVTGFVKDETASSAGLRIPPEALVTLHQPADSDLLHEAAQLLTSVPAPVPGALLWQFLELGEQVYLPEQCLGKNKVA